MSEENAKNEPYRVLARKYRPKNFDELIGQDALVRTLTNAIESGRIAHAFMMTGVRGVGKTTTARIIAKALNYAGPDGKSDATTGSTDDCPICQAITEDRHPDVIEMDAASRTGVDDIREILDGVRYAPTEARYKVYVIDEVHMLSKNAFNALLKTLEEPPEHVKFIFATTEIRKVPVTVLSRCQRFDLKRVDVPTLSAHFTSICEKEGVQAEEEAVTMIARAADGSVRDGLSLLDQAMATGGDHIKAEQVQDMLGLGDKARNLDLLEHVLSGNMPQALDIMDGLYESGLDPLVLIQDLLDLTHILTKLRAVPATESMKHALAPDEVTRAADLSTKLSMPSLAKTWQILLKGLSEVQLSPNPQNAAEMVLIRLSYAADLPDPAQLLKSLKNKPSEQQSAAVASPAPHSGSVSATSSKSEINKPIHHIQNGTHGNNPRASLAIVSKAQDKPIIAVKSLEDLVLILREHDEVSLAASVEHYVHLVKLEEGLLEIRPQEHAPPKLAQDLGQVLKRITGNRWIITISSAPGQPTIAEKEKIFALEERNQILQMPIMQDIMKAFPEAEIKSIYYKDKNKE